MHAFLKDLGIGAMNSGVSTGQNWMKPKGEVLSSHSPVDGTLIGKITSADRAAYDAAVEASVEAFKTWKLKPAPARGEIVRQVGEELRANKQALGQLVSYEMGKSLQEGLGEVQEMIDICDFAVGLSRQLHGLTMHSERPGHRMYE
ncbi:MAG: aldehyde dehydrogenase family protein, partial [Chitinophagaceae bacterium]